MKIGELVKRSNVSKDTIRYYEKMGLLKEVTRPNEYNNYKDYPEVNVYRLLAINDMKQLGFTLKEINQTFALSENGALDDSIRMGMIENKLTLINEKIEKLKNIQSILTQILKNPYSRECKNKEKEYFGKIV